MEAQLSDVQSLMGNIMTYLKPKEVAQCRQVSGPLRKREVAPNWRAYVQNSYSVRPCGMCKSLRASTRQNGVVSVRVGLCRPFVSL